MRATDARSFSNIAASTAAFSLAGGQYGVDCIATFGGGSVKLQRLGADGSTYLSVSSGTDFSANGYASVDLPAGSYRFTVATATAIYAGIVRIPGE
jgi:microcystin-dependent protein